MLHHACAQAGLASASLWASVPHYVAAAPNPKVALALVRAFEGAAGVAVDAGELETAAEDYERQVTAAVASDPEVKAFVERLESAMDEVTDEPVRGGPALGRHDRERLPAVLAPARAGADVGVSGFGRTAAGWAVGFARYAAPAAVTNALGARGVARVVLA